jgi:hypothetical protein
VTRRTRGIAAVTGCRPCWTLARIRPGYEYEPDRFVAVVHAGHVPELEAAGWTVIPHGMYDDGMTDVVCPHLAALVT